MLVVVYLNDNSKESFEDLEKAIVDTLKDLIKYDEYPDARVTINFKQPYTFDLDVENVPETIRQELSFRLKA
jgi:hypothetical protein